VLDDKKQQITITDQHNNAITMSSSGIELKSPASITIQADQKVNITGKMGSVSRRHPATSRFPV
jgi:hypothetical protein